MVRWAEHIARHAAGKECRASAAVRARSLISAGEVRTRSPSESCSLSCVADAVQMLDAAQDQAASGNRWRGPEHFPQRVLPQQFILRAGLKHEGLSIFIQAKHLAVVRPRGRCKALGARQADFVI